MQKQQPGREVGIRSPEFHGMMYGKDDKQIVKYVQELSERLLKVQEILLDVQGLGDAQASMSEEELESVDGKRMVANLVEVNDGVDKLAEQLESIAPKLREAKLLADRMKRNPEK